MSVILIEDTPTKSDATDMIMSKTNKTSTRNKCLTIDQPYLTPSYNLIENDSQYRLHNKYSISQFSSQEIINKKLEVGIKYELSTHVHKYKNGRI